MAAADFVFALASCQYPAGLVDASIGRPDGGVVRDDDIGPAGRSAWRLARLFEQPGRPHPELAILAGDQVYVDATAGLFDVSMTDADRFDEAYRAMDANPGLVALRNRGVTVWPVMDDHEIEDNWSPRSPSGMTLAERRALAKAKSFFLARQRHETVPSDPAAQPLYRALSLRGFDFFLADTRTERRGRNRVNWRTATIFGDAQRTALADWVAAHGAGAGGAPACPAFVVSPSMLLPRQLALQGRPPMALHADEWCGYPASLHEMLARVYESGGSNLVFLSGDEHLSCVATIALRRRDCPQRTVFAYSVHSSALYAPYPFANAAEADFAAQETFDFDDPCARSGAACYECTVQAWFPRTGDGFALLRPRCDAAPWRLELEFDGAAARAQAVLGDGSIRPGRRYATGAPSNASRSSAASASPSTGL